MPKRIVITGGPGTGKSTVITELERQGYACMHEISREVTLKAKKEGIEQLFLQDPILFSKLLFEGRVKQFKEVEKTSHKAVFFDRGLPDVFAYMDYLGVEYPDFFKEDCKLHLYNDPVFLMPPWEAIYITDNERYESFEQSLIIYGYLKNAYTELGYTVIEVPFGTIEKRVSFILHALNL